MRAWPPVLLTGALLAGCGGSDPVGSGPTTTSSSARSSTPTPSATMSTTASGSPSTTTAGGQLRVRPARGITRLASGLRIPWSVAFLPDGSALVTERGNRSADTPAREWGSARLLRVTPAGKVSVVQRIAVTNRVSEGGLLGIAVSPKYAADGLVYVFYTTNSDNRIARFKLGQKPQPILTGIPAGAHHNGGRLAFGPDGMLYATTGESGNPALAQNRASLGGKILRITPAGKPAPGNPFPGSAVYSYGHRDVQGLAWDARGRLFASEFGDHAVDELNLIRPGGNYGWPAVEGRSTDRRFVAPLVTWPVKQASPSGIAIRDGQVWLANLVGQRLNRVALDGYRSTSLLVREYGRLRDVVNAPDGSLWILTSNRDGRGGNYGRGAPRAEDDQILRYVP